MKRAPLSLLALLCLSFALPVLSQEGSRQLLAQAPGAPGQFSAASPYGEPPRQTQTATTPDSARMEAKVIMLQGGIKHSAKLKPVDKRLRAGEKYDEKLLTSQPAHDYWYHIPSWLGGIWQRTEQHLLSYKPLTLKAKLYNAVRPRGMGIFSSRVEYRWGHQYDMRGGIWNYVSLPYLATVGGSGDTYTVQLIRQQKPVRVTDRVVVIKFLSTSHNINRRTKVISSCEQSEALSAYTLVNPNLVYVRFSRKLFNSKGKPESIEISESYIHRVSAFQPLAFKEGKNLSVSLSRFLQAMYSRSRRTQPR